MSDRPHCGWCQSEHAPFQVQIRNRELDRDWYPSSSYQPAFGEGPVKLEAPPVMAFACRKCVRKLATECSYIDAEVL